MEKDELLGSTLVLAWVPNSRIQRQDEEALRYITPESSPVRKAPCPRGRRAQSLGTPHQPSPTEPRPALIPRDEDTLVVAQSVQDAVHVSPSPPSEEGEKPAQGLGMAPPPAHSDSGILSAVSSQDGTEEGREPRPEASEEEGSLELSFTAFSQGVQAWCMGNRPSSVLDWGCPGREVEMGRLSLSRLLLTRGLVISACPKLLMHNRI